MKLAPEHLVAISDEDYESQWADGDEDIELMIQEAALEEEGGEGEEDGEGGAEEGGEAGAEEGGAEEAGAVGAEGEGAEAVEGGGGEATDNAELPAAPRAAPIFYPESVRQGTASSASGVRGGERRSAPGSAPATSSAFLRRPPPTSTVGNNATTGEVLVQTDRTALVDASGGLRRDQASFPTLFNNNSSADEASSSAEELLLDGVILDTSLAEVDTSREAVGRGRAGSAGSAPPPGQAAEHRGALASEDHGGRSSTGVPVRVEELPPEWVTTMLASHERATSRHVSPLGGDEHNSPVDGEVDPTRPARPADDRGEDVGVRQGAEEDSPLRRGLLTGFDPPSDADSFPPSEGTQLTQVLYTERGGGAEVLSPAEELNNEDPS